MGLEEGQSTNATCRVMAVGQKVSILICSPVEGVWKKMRNVLAEC